MKTKLRGKIKEEGDTETEEQWIRRMAQGKGKQRKRIKKDIPIYGGAELNQDDRDAGSLSPKFSQYQKIKALRFKHQKQVRNA